MPFPTSHPALDRALAARGYAEPTPVQLAVLEADAETVDGRRCDMLVSAQTGSGKTVAFGLAMASTLLADRERFDTPGRPLALIIAPTRELAMQISREFEWLYAETGARAVTCVGGMSVRHEQNQLSAGAHIVIGTPGRLCDHLDKGYLDLSSLQVAVLDEADEMLDLGFREELETLLNATPADRRTLLFSATIARGIAMLAKNYQRDAVRVDTTSRTEPHGDIDYRAMRVSPGDVERAVVNVLRYFEAGGALVFCATREAVRRLHASLRERGFHAVGLSGEMNQRERNDALQSLRDGHARVCVATDVAARGLDLPDLGLVIHADLPTNKATLLHRSGRTGRAGKKGTSVLLVTHTKRRRTEQVLQSANIEATWSGPPTADEIRAQDRLRLLSHPALNVSVTEEDEALARQLAEQLPPEKIAAAVIGLLRAELPEPEDVSDDSRMRDASFERPRREREDRDYDRPARAERSFEPKPDMGARRAERGFSDNPADGVWFKLNVGRRRNADPKWLVPMICRLGHITKAEIGPIRIFDDETKFEIVPHAAEAFAVAVEATLNDATQITPSSPPQKSEKKSDATRREGFQKRERAPREDRPREDRPREERTRERTPRETHQRDDRPPREARKPRHEATSTGLDARNEARAAIEADPVLASLKAAESASPQAPVQNRRERRDAARAAGKLAPIAANPGAPSPTSGDAPLKRTWKKPAQNWSPDDAPPEQPGTSGAEGRPHRGKPHASKEGFSKEGFRPRGERGPGGKPSGKPSGKLHRGSPHKSGKPGGKPAGKFGGKPGGKFSGKPAGKGARGFGPGRSRP